MKDIPTSQKTSIGTDNGVVDHVLNRGQFIRKLRK